MPRTGSSIACFALFVAWSCNSTSVPTSPPPDASNHAAAEPNPQTDTEAQDDAAVAPADGSRPYELVFVSELGGWNNSVDVTAEGDPVFINSRTAFLVARHDGSVLERAEISCLPPHNALHFIDAKVGVLGCDDRIMEVEMPGLRFRVAHQIAASSHQEEIESFTAQAGAVAYGTQSGKVVVLERKPPGYAVLLELAFPREVETLALSPDAQTLVVGINGRLGVQGEEESFIEIYEVKTGKQLRRSAPQGRSRITAMSYSPDGTLVFAHATTFEAGIFDPSTAAWRNNFSVGSWMSSSVWLAPNLVAGAGSDGVALFPLDRGETFALKTNDAEHPPPAEGIGATDDGSYVCSADRDGRAACWSNRPVTSTTYRPAAPLVR